MELSGEVANRQACVGETKRILSIVPEGLLAVFGSILGTKRKTLPAVGNVEDPLQGARPRAIV
jgi:hypothetical protein